MVLVPASAPVRYYDLGLLFADHIADGQRALLVERDLGIGVRQKGSPRADQGRGLFGGLALHLAILLHRSGARGAAFTERQTQEDSLSAALDLLRHRSPHGEHSVAG